MAGTTLAKSGLVLSQDGETTWHTELREGHQRLEDRLGLSYAGDPNRHVAGSWFGQSCYDTVNQAIYFCVRVGDIAVAQWVSQGEDPTPPGKVDFFFRNNLPVGWLPFDGVPRLQADYPRLYNVLPNSVKNGPVFTLPNVDERLSPLFGGTGTIGALAGSGGTGTSGGIPARNVTAQVFNNPNDAGEHGYISSGYVTSAGSGTPHIQYIQEIIAQRITIPAVGDHAHFVETRGMIFTAGVHF